MITPREGHGRDVLERIAEDYRRRGYEVLVEPKGRDLPAFLSADTPDLIAQRDNEHLVIEVKQSPMDVDSRQLNSIREKVSQQPGWRFVLMAVKPNGSDAAAGGLMLLDESGIRESLSQAESLAKTGYSSAALMLAWSATEGLLRRLLADRPEGPASVAPAFLLRSATSEGLIGADDFARLNDILRLRSAVAHGFRPARDDVSTEAVDATTTLRRISESLLAEFRKSA